MRLIGVSKLNFELLEKSVQSCHRRLVFPPSLEHLIRSVKHRLRDRETDLLRRLQVNYELKLRRLLHRQVGGLGSFQDLVHVKSCAAKQIRRAWPIGHKSSGFDELPFS